MPRARAGTHPPARLLTQGGCQAGPALRHGSPAAQGERRLEDGGIRRRLCDLGEVRVSATSPPMPLYMTPRSACLHAWLFERVCRQAEACLPADFTPSPGAPYRVGAPSRLRALLRSQISSALLIQFSLLVRRNIVSLAASALAPVSPARGRDLRTARQSWDPCPAAAGRTSLAPGNSSAATILSPVSSLDRASAPWVTYPTTPNCPSSKLSPASPAAWRSYL